MEDFKFQALLFSNAQRKYNKAPNASSAISSFHSQCHSFLNSPRFYLLIM